MKREVFNRAAEIVNERGWGTGSSSFYGTDGPVCILGAVRLAAVEQGLGWAPDYDDLERASYTTTLAEVIGVKDYAAGSDKRTPNARRVYVWNDRLIGPYTGSFGKWRAKRKVIKALKKAAKVS